MVVMAGMDMVRDLCCLEKGFGKKVLAMLAVMVAVDVMRYLEHFEEIFPRLVLEAQMSSF
jgi:hypothetical protein